MIVITLEHYRFEEEYDGARVPDSAQFMWEVDAEAGKVIIVDGSKSLYSTDDFGAIYNLEFTSTAHDYIVAGWHDRVNQRIYVLEYKQATNSVVSYLDYSTWGSMTTATLGGNLDDSAGNQRMYYSDVFIRDGNIEALTNSSVTKIMRHSDGEATGSWSQVAATGGFPGTFGSGYVCHIGTTVWWFDDNSGTMRIQYYDGGASITRPYSNAAYGPELNGKNAYWLTYDGNNNLYMQWRRDSDSKRVLIEYSISGNSITVLSDEFNLAMQLPRDVIGTAPNETPKAIVNQQITNGYVIYEFKPESGTVVLLQDLTGETSPTVAISSNLMMDTAGRMFKYNNVANEISFIEIDGEVSELTECLFRTELPSITNQFIKFYEEDRLIFEGHIKKKKIINGVRQYHCLSPNKEMKHIRFTKSYTAQSAKAIMEDLLDTYGNYLHYITGSIHSNLGSGSYTIEFKNKTFREAFDTLMDLEDGLWSVTPNETVYAYKLADIPYAELGDYAGKWSFTGETTGDNPVDWSVLETGGTVEIFASLDEHNDVVELDDTSATLHTELYKTVIQGLDTTFEFHIAKSDIAVSKDGFIEISEGATRLIQLRLQDDDMDYYPSGGPWTSVKDDFIVASTFFHVKLVLNDTANTYDIWIDGVSEKTGAAYENNSTSGADTIKFLTDNTFTTYKIYVDAVDYSLAEGYFDGRNKINGDVLFKTTTETSGHISSVPKFSQLIQTINKVHIYGGVVSGARLESTANDSNDQAINGITEYVDHFPHIVNQAQLDTLATAILNRTGISTNPIYLSVYLDITFRQFGRAIYFEFDGYEELEIPTIYYIIKYTYYPLDETAMVVLSSGLVQEGREYQIDIHKTSNADEEQIDIVAATPEIAGDLTPQLFHNFTAAVALVDGNLCYINGSGKMDKVDASAKATCDTLLAMCVETISADAVGKFLCWGKYPTTGLTTGAEYFASETAGAITLTKPTTSASITRKIGTALSTIVLFFKPSEDFLEYV